MSKTPAKRVDIVSLKMVREKFILYENRKITSPVNVVYLVRDFIEDSDREKFLAIYLNTKNEPNAIHTISIGNLNSSIVHPREVMKSAILSNSNGIILVHNHPSGDTRPSNEDIAITERLIDGAQILGLKILDHIIIGHDGDYYSFKENNLM